ncbi:hypothetical protein CDAR_524841 [Caerostris darwini]|uniref:Uncharacterized protein n=1 Tax=Caerostris darwini TaxID=1538125 RepID=A0AAV4R005_9ARAC|nr:hypothetical protein CDAR_524841 [Caerostris darwini]
MRRFDFNFESDDSLNGASRGRRETFPCLHSRCGLVTSEGRGERKDDLLCFRSGSASPTVKALPLSSLSVRRSNTIRRKCDGFSLPYHNIGMRNHS